MRRTKLHFSSATIFSSGKISSSYKILFRFSKENIVYPKLTTQINLYEAGNKSLDLEKYFNWALLVLTQLAPVEQI